MNQGRKVGLYRPCMEFAITRGQKAYLALGAHDIFCDTGLDFRTAHCCSVRFNTFASATVLLRLLRHFCSRWSKNSYFKLVFRLKNVKIVPVLQKSYFSFLIFFSTDDVIYFFNVFFFFFKHSGIEF